MARCVCQNGIAMPMPDGNHIYCERCTKGRALKSHAVAIDFVEATDCLDETTGKACDALSAFKEAVNHALDDDACIVYVDSLGGGIKREWKN